MVYASDPTVLKMKRNVRISAKLLDLIPDEIVPSFNNFVRGFRGTATTAVVTEAHNFYGAEGSDIFAMNKKGDFKCVNIPNQESIHEGNMNDARHINTDNFIKAGVWVFEKGHLSNGKAFLTICEVVAAPVKIEITAEPAPSLPERIVVKTYVDVVIDPTTDQDMDKEWMARLELKDFGYSFNTARTLVSDGGNFLMHRDQAEKLVQIMTKLGYSIRIL